jgi:hypothetical protein
MPDGMRLFTISMFLCVYWSPKPKKLKVGDYCTGALAEKQAVSRCGLQVIDLRTGDVVHHLRIEGMVHELYDVAVIPQVRRPMAIGFRTDEIRRMISVQ